MTNVIKNFDALATSKLRKDALSIAEAAYAAIDTDSVVRAALSLSGDTLQVGGRSYDLSKFKRVRIIGFGKASGKAIQTIESVLHGRLKDGIAIDIRPGLSKVVEVLEATHPRPTPRNVEVSTRLVGMAEDSNEDDLVIVVVSGGGSSLLCYPLGECDQSARLYEDFKKTGATIEEMNTVRKHISAVKGGGLAVMLRPATVIGLIFSDIVGGKPEDVASGPTYFDETTAADAQRVLDQYGLSGYTLNETNKDKTVFEKVQNVEVVSNLRALEAMTREARELGYTAINAGANIYDETAALVARMHKELGAKTAVLSGGEPALRITKPGGKGGRCGYSALRSIPILGPGDVFLAFASDGRDNSDAAGVIADAQTPSKIEKANASIQEALDSFDAFTIFEKTGDLLLTGPTDANVSDLFVMLRG